MSPQIDLQPQTLDLFLYSGDGISLKLNCTNSSEAPVPITGTVKAQVRANRISEDNPILEFTVNLAESSTGIVTLSLTGAQTKTLIEPSSGFRADKFSGVWDVQWTPAGSQPRTLVQGKVECVADVSR